MLDQFVIYLWIIRKPEMVLVYLRNFISTFPWNRCWSWSVFQEFLNFYISMKCSELQFWISSQKLNASVNFKFNDALCWFIIHFTCLTMWIFSLAYSYVSPSAYHQLILIHFNWSSRIHIQLFFLTLLFKFLFFKTNLSCSYVLLLDIV